MWSKLIQKISKFNFMQKWSFAVSVGGVNIKENGSTEHQGSTFYLFYVLGK